jgi:hypothetical protein
MALPKKFNKFSNKTSSKSFIRISHCEAKKAKSQVTGQEKEYLEAYIDGVNPTDRQQLINLWSSSIPKNVMAVVAHPKYDKGIILKINIDKISDLGTTFIDKLTDCIKSLGTYDDTSVNAFGDSLMDKIAQCPTEADIANSNAKIASNWKELLSKLQDPDFRKMLLNFQTTVACAKKYGHILSKKNVMSILSQNPMASFVTTPETWRVKFNRQIKPGAQKIIVTKSSNYGNTSWAARNNSARAHGFQDMKDAKDFTNNSVQTMGSIEMDANKGNSGFYKVIMYDVADTIPPADPKDDVFTNDIGLINNLTGAINSAAQTKEDQLKAQLGTVQSQQQVQPSASSSTAMAKRRGIIEWLCQKKNIPTLKNVSDEEFIVDGAYQYSKVMAKSLGYVKSHDIERIALVSTLLVAISSGINEGNHKILSSVGGNTVYNDDDVMSIFTITNTIIPTMAKKISESKIFEGMEGKKEFTIDDIINMAIKKYGLPEEQIEEQRKIKNNFVNLFNRMIK